MDTFVLWDRDTANVFGSYSTRAAALQAVRGLLEANGSSIAADLILVREDASGVPTSLGGGESLAVEALMDAMSTRLTESVAAISESFIGTLTGWVPTFGDWDLTGNWSDELMSSVTDIQVRELSEPLGNWIREANAEWLSSLTVEPTDAAVVDEQDGLNAAVERSANKQSTLALAA